MVYILSSLLLWLLSNAAVCCAVVTCCGPVQHVVTRFCERIVPAETTCLLTAAALEGALTRVVQGYLTQQQQQQQQGAGDSGADATDVQQPLEFAVLYKSRGVDRQILAEMEKEAAKQDQQDQQQAQVQEQQPDGVSKSPAAKAAAAAVSAGDTSSTGLDRQQIIDMAAAVMNACCKDTGGAKVNLSKPKVGAGREITVCTGGCQRRYQSLLALACVGVCCLRAGSCITSRLQQKSSGGGGQPFGVTV